MLMWISCDCGRVLGRFGGELVSNAVRGREYVIGGYFDSCDGWCGL